MRKASVFSFQFKTIALVSSTALVATASLQALSNNFKNISLKESISSFLDAGTKLINGVSGLGAGSSLLYGSVYNAGSTVYNVGSFATEQIKNTAEKSYSGINNGISWGNENFSKATSFLQKAYDAVVKSAPTVGNAIWSGSQTVYDWLQKNWQSTIVAQIKKYADLSKLKENLGLDNGNWDKVKKGFSDFFDKFKTSPSEAIRDFAYNFYRVTFKFIGPWGWSFLDAGIFQNLGYKQLWEKIIKAGKLKETLVEVMKFFKKFQNTLERMDYETRNTIVKLFLENPENLLQIIKTLNENKGTDGAASIILNPKQLESLLNLNPEQLQTRLMVGGISDAAILETGKTIGTATGTAIKAAETVLDVLTDNKKSQGSIAEPVQGIITNAATTASDLVTTFVSGAFSIFGIKLGGDDKKPAQSQQEQAPASK